MKTNKKVQKNNVQKSEKETAVKVTALAIIPKPMKLLTSQNMPTATEVTETPEAATAVPEMATVPTVTEEAPQQAETDLDITTVHPSANNHRKTFKDASLQELAESIREVGSCRPLRYAHARKAVMKSYTVNAVTVPHCLQEQRP